MNDRDRCSPGLARPYPHRTRNSYTGNGRRPRKASVPVGFFRKCVGKQVELPACVRLGTFALAVALVANWSALRAAPDASAAMATLASAPRPQDPAQARPTF